MEVIRFDLNEACAKLGIDEEFVVQCIRSRWIRPIGPFELDQEDLSRVEFVRELRDDFGVNDAAVPIILDLVDRLLCLENQLRRVGHSRAGAGKF